MGACSSLHTQMTGRCSSPLASFSLSSPPPSPLPAPVAIRTSSVIALVESAPPMAPSISSRITQTGRAISGRSEKVPKADCTSVASLIRWRSTLAVRSSD